MAILIDGWPKSVFTRNHRVYGCIHVASTLPKSGLKALFLIQIERIGLDRRAPGIAADKFGIERFLVVGPDGPVKMGITEK